MLARTLFAIGLALLGGACVLLVDLEKLGTGGTPRAAARPHYCAEPQSLAHQECLRFSCVRRGPCTDWQSKTAQEKGCLKFVCSRTPFVCPPNYIRIAGKCVPGEKGSFR